MGTRAAIRFLRRGRIVECSSFAPSLTVLDYLRLEEKSRGTKEGCNEGDCGACTVVVGSLRDGRLVYEPLNACITLLAQLHGRELVTVEDLAAGGKLHPVQQALVDSHASQCGFCTPGFVMALFALYHAGAAPGRAEVVDQLAGNLCRCTGYRPIIAAALASCTGAPDDAWAAGANRTMRQLALLDDGEDVMVGDSESFLARPCHAETLATICADHPDATVVGGATDVALWITKQLRPQPKIVLTAGVGELRRVSELPDRVLVGAAATYAEAWAALGGIDPDLAEAMRRLGSVQVRSSGTIGGNIANGSPIGDMAPMLIALGARLHLRQRDSLRSMPLEDFFIAYGRQDRRPGELVWQIEVPRLGASEVFRAAKIAKRFDQDISAVMGAFRLVLDGRRIAGARLAFGGMAATPRRAPRTEAALAAADLDDPRTWSAAFTALAADFQPISDLRASAAYRAGVAEALLRKTLMEAGGASATRLLGGRREVA